MVDGCKAHSYVIIPALHPLQSQLDNIDMAIALEEGRGNYCIHTYLSFIQRKNLEIVCNPCDYN